MGGNAFAPTLYTPRMPPAVYDVMRDNLVRMLKMMFDLAESPLPAPGKKDHGDIDILVCNWIRDLPLTMEEVAEVFNAKEFKKTPGSSTTHFAIPWPEEFDHIVTQDTTSVPEPQKPIDPAEVTSQPTPSPRERFIQLDLHDCFSPHSFTYTLFHQAHGDFWNIIGAMIRRYGLTISHSGLYVRIAEIEPHNKDKARILLSGFPNAILKFLGLDVTRFWTQFKTLDEMMEYASTCKFHDPGRYQNPQEHKEDLKSNDRQREKKRPHFRYWIEEYLPKHSEGGRMGEWAKLSRDDVVDLVKREFGIAKEFDERKAKYVRLIGEEKMWADIRKNLPTEGVEIGYVMKGLKREIVFEAEDKGVDEKTAIQSAFAQGRFEEVVEFAKVNWEEVGTRQKKLDMEKSKVNLLAKLERMRIAEGGD